jgi:predicted molibdopterin-dependent oxidoreductase YjgC
MTLHFQDQVRVNVLTTDVSDAKSGVSEFKACAVQLEPVRAGDATRSAAEHVLVPGD